jgi:hypothetical protein
VSEDLQRLPVGFPRDVHKALKRAAFEQGTTMSAIVVKAVREKLGMTEASEIRASERRSCVEQLRAEAQGLDPIIARYGEACDATNAQHYQAKARGFYAAADLLDPSR